MQVSWIPSFAKQEALMSSIKIRQTHKKDIPALIALQERIYPTIPPWSKVNLVDQLEAFPQGQIIAENANGLVGCASSIMVMWDDWEEPHSWNEITSSGTFDNHNPLGRTLYGVEVFVDPACQGQGVGHLLYEGRRNLCRAMNLKRIIACGRLPGYHEYANEMSVELYAQKVVWGDIVDPVLSFQIHEGLSYCGVMPDYIPEDNESCGHASLIVWLNADYRRQNPVTILDDIVL
jgi:N-acetylglutamate synthase-like GNAT family acetyltransferase